MNNVRKRRGSTALGLATVTLFLGAMCGIIMSRSLDVYKSSADLQLRLQIQAALEGATVLLRRDAQAALSPTRIGNCVVESQSVGVEESEVSRTVRISALGANGQAVMERTTSINFRREGGDRWIVIPEE